MTVSWPMVSRAITRSDGIAWPYPDTGETRFLIQNKALVIFKIASDIADVEIIERGDEH
jgi:hypothetical protein